MFYYYGFIGYLPPLNAKKSIPKRPSDLKESEILRLSRTTEACGGGKKKGKERERKERKEGDNRSCGAANADQKKEK